MADRICYGLHTDFSEVIVETVKVQNGQTFYVGDILSAETLVSGSKKVYAPTVVADATAEKPAIIIDQGIIKLSDGRRVEGGNLLTDLSFIENDVIHVVRLEDNLKFEISVDSLGNTGVVAPAVGKYLIPANGEQKLQTADAIGTANVALVIESLATIPTGGNMALGYASSVIARVVKA